MVKLAKNGEKVVRPDKTKSIQSKKQNKYEQLTGKKRKNSENNDKSEKKVIKNEKLVIKEEKIKKEPSVNDKKTLVDTSEDKENKKTKLNKIIKSKGSIGEKAKFKNGKGPKFNKDQTKKIVASTPAERKELFKKRKQKKLADNYEITINMKKIWETLRKSETTDETKKKLCSSLFEQVKDRIKQLSFAHDTVRVIECLVQYGTEKHREGVFVELKDEFVEMAKEKYARFLLKKILTYGTKEQKETIVNAFTGRVTKLIKHSFACQIVESLFNEYASHTQRNQMLMEFYDPTFALLHNQKCKSLKEVLEVQQYSKETILNNIKDILTTCADKTILMFSIIHRVFSEFFQNCDPKQKTEMIELLSEQLIHMVHTRDGASVAMQCVWNSSAKERKKIIKSMKTFVVKIALEEHGHMVLLAILDSVDDTKLVSKGILDELLRSMDQVIENDFGRKVISYLIAPRDSRFYIKDYVNRLEQGDSSETSKKDPEKRRAELFDFIKPAILAYLKKKKDTILYNGSFGILVPIFLEKLGNEGDDLIRCLADTILQEAYEPVDGSDKKQHCIEETFSAAIMENDKVENITSWIECNRGCFMIVNLIETSNDKNKKTIKKLIKSFEQDLKAKAKFKGAKLLLEKLNQI
ncbi:pumilio domain-containing KIAA0020-like protein [Brachionus plicatilis]|uniref:Pumilio domain-containing KIAA0020-like protein n=1 Tax=Brachionus plicatilis TaxID=10195 RepID=A0A3M7RS60_BRAPC|nr:pumilio domain-containing KIAA0020-like protein [Brachionus plicatilis]